MMSKYQGEQKELSESITKYQKERKETEDTTTDAERCAELLTEFAGLSELTSEILNTLISRIDIHEPKEVDGVMQQDIDIYYHHAGLIDSVGFGSSRFYKSESVKQASRKRMKGKTLEVAVQNVAVEGIDEQRSKSQNVQRKAG